MNPNTQFEKYHPKFRKEAWLRSVLAAVSIGFGAAFMAALVTWFLSVNGLWISLAVLVVVTAALSPVFYSKKYRPTVMEDARRLDAIGLKERMVTMVEFAENDSCMVQVQRRDAQQVLSNVEVSQIRMKISRTMIVVAVIAALLCSAMTTVTALSAYGYLKSGEEMLENILPQEPDVYYTVTYIVEEGGYIEGEKAQLVLAGDDAEPVLAVAEDGFAFVEWDDGSGDPARTDAAVTSDLTFIAIFAPLDEEDPEGGESGDSGEARDGEPGEGDGEGSQEGDSPQDGEGDEPGDSTGGKYEEWNQIINGETYYREFLEAYKERLIQQLEEHGDELTEEERAIIEAYINLV